VLHVRVISPGDTTAKVVDLLEDDPTVANLVVIRGTAQRGTGDLLIFDVARENANQVLECLRDLGLEESGAVAFEEAEQVEAHAARQPPGPMATNP